jgi:hypothetical protein
MLDWFKPKLPISPEEREWVDSSLDWLLKTFGEERFQQVTVVLPTPEFFPQEWDGTPACVQIALEQVCRYMQVDSERLELQFFSEEGLPGEIRRGLPEWEEQTSGAAGLYQETQEQQATISINREQLREPDSVIATIAHELGHVLLLADRRLSRRAANMEPMTDLITVFLGMGIFTANSAIQYRTFTDVQQSGWSISRQGYLSEQLWGYALARFTRMRGEPRPTWVRHLTLNVRTYMNQSLRYLAREEDAARGR